MNNPKGERPKGMTFDEGKTKQAPTAECDINNIVARYKRTGQVTHLAKARPMFADVSNVGDLRAALERVAVAREGFMMLPPALRSRFNQDPVQLLEWLSNPANRKEAVQLGLMVAKEEPKEEPKEAPKKEAPKVEPKAPEAPQAPK